MDIVILWSVGVYADLGVRILFIHIIIQVYLAEL